MYKIGEQFKLNINSKAKDENIIKGQKFRITILSELIKGITETIPDLIATIVECIKTIVLKCCNKICY